MKKATSAALLLVALMPLTGAWARSTSPEDTHARTITRVVKLLQNMGDKSKQEGDLDRELYAKFKCYCDTQEASHKTSIKSLTMEIGMLESEIAALQGSNGELSADSGKLKFDIAENEKARSNAEGMRRKARDAFLADEADLDSAIGQMKLAIELLSQIGADQTLSEGVDHTKFMSSFNRSKTPLALLKSSVKAALLAASTIVKPKQQRSVESFLQDPFTGSYTSQSAEVFGILKDMHDTFQSNLQSARATEAAQQKAHDAYISAKLASWNLLSTAYSEKQERMASNDQGLGTKKSALSQAKDRLAEDEDFLTKLIPMCAEKTKRYEERKMLRTSEEAAIAETIAILNSDAAFATFGKVDATLRGPVDAQNFLQVTSIRRHVPAAKFSAARRVKGLLRGGRSSPGLTRVMALLEAENPFTVVLQEITKMMELLDSEGKADKDKLDWCVKERADSNSRIGELDGQISELSAQIADLKSTISAPVTGLEAQIASNEDRLKNNRESQVSQTQQRTKENQLYQKDIAELVDTQDLLRRAIAVLEKYYTSLDKHYEGALLQANIKDDPQPPSLFKDDRDFAGQSVNGTDAISMLKFIKRNAKQEEDTAHEDEGAAQRAFEDSMATMTEDEKSLETSLATLGQDLATAQVNLLAKEDANKTATTERDAVRAYLVEIKPGCDFITNHIDERDGNRGSEKTALEEARDLIKNTTHYNDAEDRALHESWGSCEDICMPNPEHKTCKACLADVTVPAYCAGHPDAEGCTLPPR